MECLYRRDGPIRNHCARQWSAGPNTGTQVQLRNGKRVIHDGPYADTKEHIGGYFIIEVPSLDDALEWAARSPSSLTRYDRSTAWCWSWPRRTECRLIPALLSGPPSWLARESYGRLVSYLAWQWRDIAAAQDALNDALLKALEVWPVSGNTRIAGCLDPDSCQAPVAAGCPP